MLLHRKLADLLIDGNFASARKVTDALNEQQETGERFTAILLRKQIIDEQTCAALLRLQEFIEDPEFALQLAADDRRDLGKRLLSSGYITQEQYDQIDHSRPHTARYWLKNLRRRGALDPYRAAMCLRIPRRASERARARANIRLGDLLVEHGDLTYKQLRRALKIQRKTGKPLGDVLRDKDMVSSAKLQRCIRLQHKLAAAAFGASLSVSGVQAYAETQIAQLDIGNASPVEEALSELPEALPDALPAPVAHYPQLRDSQDNRIQAQLEAAIDRLGLRSAVNRNQLSLALVDVTNPTQPRMAHIDGERMRYAASLPKIAILFGAFQRIHNGELELTAARRQQLTDMIRVSSNSAATRSLNEVGMRNLNAMLESPEYGFYDRAYGGGLWVGKPFAKSGPQQRDPLHNISHGASAMQVARFLYMMETGRLVSPEASAEMKQMLGNPGINHKFVLGLRSDRPGSQIFRKSGSWRHFHTDGAIVERDGRRYIAVALAENSAAKHWLPRLIVAMDDIVFDPANDSTRLAAVTRR